MQEYESIIYIVGMIAYFVTFFLLMRVLINNIFVQDDEPQGGGDSIKDFWMEKEIKEELKKRDNGRNTK